MRALTLWQPWAHAVVYLGKHIENRTWPPPKWLTGNLVAIHAGKRIDEDSWALFEEAGVQLPHRSQLAKGAVIGVCRVVGATRSMDVVPEDQRKWFFGPWGWILADLVPVEPIPMRGFQGLWRVPTGYDSQLKEEWKRWTTP